MEKNKQDKEITYGPYGLNEVVILRRMPDKVKGRLGWLFHKNPDVFIYAMKHASSDAERRLYFNLCLNAARNDAGEQFTQYALALVGGVSLITSAGSIFALTPFLRQGAMLGSRAALKGNILASRLSVALQGATSRGYSAVSNAMLRNASQLRDISNITAKMIYPKNVTFKMMVASGAADGVGQLAVNTVINRYNKDYTWRDAGIQGAKDINSVSIGASALQFPLVLNTALSAGFRYSENEQKSIFDQIGVKEFLYDWGTDYAFGKAQNNVSYSFSNKKAATATGSNVSLQTPHLTETAIQRTYRHLRWGEKICEQTTVLGISLYKEYVDKQIEKQWNKFDKNSSDFTSPKYSPFLNRNK